MGNRRNTAGYPPVKKAGSDVWMSLDELIEFDIDVQEIQEIIDKTNEKVSDKIDWTKAWSKKYPILARYQNEVDTTFYMEELRKLLNDLKKKYGYNDLDAFLVLKDILAVLWKKDGAAE